MALGRKGRVNTEWSRSDASPRKAAASVNGHSADPVRRAVESPRPGTQPLGAKVLATAPLRKQRLQDLMSHDFLRGTTTLHLEDQDATAARTTSHGCHENPVRPAPVSQLRAVMRQPHCSSLTRFPAAAAPYCLRSAEVCATSGWSRCAPRPEMGLSRVLFDQATTAG